jgi:hypothetical protein
MRTLVKQILYRIYQIISTATDHEGLWRPHCCVSWHACSPHVIEFRDVPPFTTESDAQEYALQLGKEWVHRRLRSKRRRRVLIAKRFNR